MERDKREMLKYKILYAVVGAILVVPVLLWGFGTTMREAVAAGVVFFIFGMVVVLVTAARDRK